MATRGEKVAEGENCVRYVSPRFNDNDLIDGAAFQLRASDEGELSVNLIGTEEAEHEGAVALVRRRARIALKKNGRFAQLSAADVRDALSAAEVLTALDLIHDPLPAEGEFEADDSHAAIVNLPGPGSEFAALAGDLLAERIKRVHQAV